MRAAIYTRVSSEEQLEGYSLEAQEDVTRHFCAGRGWQVVCLYEERGRSGKTVFRPEFQAMLRDAEAGLFDVLVVHKLDRFSRSLLDMLTYLNKLSDYGASLTSATEQFDFTTPIGKLVLAVLGAFAQWYVDNLSQETKKGKLARAKAGDWNGVLNYGYTTPQRLRNSLTALGEQFRAGDLPEADYSEQAEQLEGALEKYGHLHNTHAVPCPINRHGLTMIYELYSTGKYSTTEVAFELNEAGYRTTGHYGPHLFGDQAVRRILKNHFYLGVVRYKDHWKKGNHEALVTEELFERCQQVLQQHRALSNTSVYRPKAKPYPLSGLMTCLNCGSNWIGHPRRGVRYYMDACRRGGVACEGRPASVKAAVLEQKVQEFTQLLDAEIPDDWRELWSEHEQRKVSPKKPDNDVENRRRALESRLKRAQEMYVMGDWARAQYQSVKDDVSAKLSALPEVVSVGKMCNNLDDVMALLRRVDVLIGVATPDELRSLYQTLFQRLYIDAGQLAAIEPSNVLWQLLNSYSHRHSTASLTA